ncbi:unnamed protein product [Ilex paraguariensis]|uniref:Uncharacterized protein n=1 Tax=Ilex paraguariensis TaxID=185542 RepID=A0ABC8TQW9_9AQUA
MSQYCPHLQKSAHSLNKVVKEENSIGVVISTGATVISKATDSPTAKAYHVSNSKENGLVSLKANTKDHEVLEVDPSVYEEPTDSKRSSKQKQSKEQAINKNLNPSSKLAVTKNHEPNRETSPSEPPDPGDGGKDKGDPVVEVDTTELDLCGSHLQPNEQEKWLVNVNYVIRAVRIVIEDSYLTVAEVHTTAVTIAEVDLLEDNRRRAQVFFEP